MLKRTIITAMFSASVLAGSAFAVHGPLFVSVNGGVNFLSISDQNSKSDINTGFGVGGAADFNVMQHLRLGLSYDYLRNSVGSSGGFYEAQSVVLVNATYDFGNMMHNISPRLAVGLGYNDLSSKTSGSATTVTVSNGGFAWRVGLGANYSINEHFDMGLGYRYTGASIDGANKTSNTLTNNSVIAVLSYRIALD